MSDGPLRGLKVVEMAALGPAPFCGMVLSDMGADVVRVDRGGDVDTAALPYLGRGRRSVALDLTHPAGLAALLRIVDRADALLEGFRPGVAERLGFGPDVCLARNPRLVYGRVTGWGQEGPLRAAAGHDINYIALAGVLGAIGPPGRPPALPLNLVGDFGGGGMLLALGVLAALQERSTSGQGQVVDAAMVDGALLQMATVLEMAHRAAWPGERGHNSLDGGAPFYRTYETADGQYVAFGAIEDQFYARFAAAVGLSGKDAPDQWDRASWPQTAERVAAVIATRTLAEWVDLLGADPDLCFTPVLAPAEAHRHPQHQARGAFVTLDGWRQPAPAPRFSRTPGAVGGGSPRPGEHTRAVLADWGFDPAEVGDLMDCGAAREPQGGG
jgi:alpha-methylacyl-CoA racemase